LRVIAEVIRASHRRPDHRSERCFSGRARAAPVRRRLADPETAPSVGTNRSVRIVTRGFPKPLLQLGRAGSADAAGYGGRPPARRVAGPRARSSRISWTMLGITGRSCRNVTGKHAAQAPGPVLASAEAATALRFPGSSGRCADVNGRRLGRARACPVPTSAKDTQARCFLACSRSDRLGTTALGSSRAGRVGTRAPGSDRSGPVKIRASGPSSSHGIGTRGPVNQCFTPARRVGIMPRAMVAIRARRRAGARADLTITWTMAMVASRDCLKADRVATGHDKPSP
jgi:hypothetical protein